MGNSGRSAELDEIWSLFSQESRDNLLAVEETLLKLEQDPSDLEQVKVLFRALHSFKGAARMMGLSVTESMTHHAEDLIALVRDQGVALDRDIIDMVLTALDRMRAILDHVLANGSDVEPSQVQDISVALQELIARKQPVEQAPVHVPGPNGNGHGNGNGNGHGNGNGNGNGNGTDKPAESTESVVLQPSATEAQESLPVAVAEEPPAQPEPSTVVVVEEPQALAAVLEPAIDATGLLPEATPEVQTGQDSPPSSAPEMTNFIHFVQDALGQLHSAQDDYATGNDNALQDIQSVARKLATATELMGNQRLLTVLEGFALEAQATDNVGNREARVVRFQKLEMAVFEELTQIQDTMATS
jgi:two-component system, chemotaxis family, sensor kinase CheA